MREQVSKLPDWFNDLSNFEKEKLLSDRFYFSQMKAGHNYSLLCRSGWLNHPYSLEEIAEVQSSYYTPFESYAGSEKEIFILLNTGSYAPAHMGHVNLLKKAKEKIRELGLSSNPIMVLSPSHDKYVLSKSEDILNWNIDLRMEKLSQIVEEYPYKDKSDNFLIDPWEACYCQYPINFTDVINKYIKDLENLGIKYKIGYVFGSDNEQFLYPFSNLSKEDKSKFFAICIEREDFPFKIKSESNNVIYIEKDEKYSHLKSRDIRKNIIFQNIKVENQQIQSDFAYHKNGFYAIRQDNILALQKWIEIYPEKEDLLKSTYQNFHEGLKKLIKEFLNIEVKSISLEAQKSFVANLNRNNKYINLDIGTNSITENYALHYGRIFIPSSMQEKPIKMVLRPEFENESLILPGQYIFIDDDIASGNTFRLVQEKLLSQNVTLNGYINLAREYFISQNIEYNLFDIIDTKDFLLGTYTGGLICEVHGKSLRLPYFAKYVNLKTRANIDYSKIVQFNQKLLNLNQDFFVKNMYLTLNDINSELAEFMFVGVNLDTPIYKRIYKF